MDRQNIRKNNNLRTRQDCQHKQNQVWPVSRSSPFLQQQDHCVCQWRTFSNSNTTITSVDVSSSLHPFWRPARAYNLSQLVSILSDLVWQPYGPYGYDKTGWLASWRKEPFASELGLTWTMTAHDMSQAGVSSFMKCCQVGSIRVNLGNIRIGSFGKERRWCWITHPTATGVTVGVSVFHGYTHS
ncbi:uncharacterized protein YALI1_C22282g [Yarrowia lipolytica]|uniref:Uncharacterized protein n=1 Tax=Yarrowia lipolytica TaxID=4952 RepID=A0A1D8NBE1_YARLL|nr:hypothetical protein YALI1_C22282g [Yarrowia lipolytica]